MAKQCAVNRNADGQITSVEVQNLDNVQTDNYIQDFIDSSAQSSLLDQVKADPGLYETAVDNYVNSKASINQVMRDLGADSKTLFYDILAELGVPIKLPITEQQYNDIKADLANGATKNEIFAKYKVSAYTYKYLSRDTNVELIDKKQTKEGIKVKDIAPEMVQSILDDRIGGMSLEELTAKYPIPLSALKGLLKINKLLKMQMGDGTVKNIYSNTKGGKIPYQSKKLGKWITGDSQYEIARFIELDNDPNVLTYTREVPPIFYNNGKSRYYPDIQVTYTDGRVEVEEIKLHKIITKGDLLTKLQASGASEEEIRKQMNLSPTMFKITEKARDKIQAAREYYAKEGITYKIMTENEIDIKLADYSSLTKLSAKDKRTIKKAEKQGIDLKQKEFIPSQLFEELTQQPFVDNEQALDAYKNIYSDELNQWKDNTDLEC